MEYQRFGDTYVIRLDRGEEVLTSLTDLCRRENIVLGSVQGLGASDHAVIGLYDLTVRQYHKIELKGPMEITSLIGGISTKNREPYLHLHVNLCCEDMHVVGARSPVQLLFHHKKQKPHHHHR